MNDTEQQFWSLVEGLIEEANQQASSGEPTQVSHALLYAAARFNVYVTAAATASRAEFKEQQQEIKALLMEQFEAMLDANLDDYLENYKVYLER
ncbi:MAG TPA: DUF3144 domain-containing protein [Pseudomonadaceae bacterium]|nr:DUF3144 domain-containing protein [Pseudomonadaceae bacterium]